MKKSLTILALIFISNWAFNQIYFQSVPHNFNENDAVYDYTFTNVPTSGTLLYNPKFHVQVKGDFNTATKGFDLLDKDSNVIHSFRNITSRCNDTIFEYTMTQSEFMSYLSSDTLAVKIGLTNAVDIEFCDRNYVFLSLEVNRCAADPATTDYLHPTITFSQSSVCSGAGQINPVLWPIGGTLSGTGVIQSGLNFGINTTNLTPDTTYEYIYKQTNLDGCEFIGRGSIEIKKSPANLDLTVCAGSEITVNTPAHWYDDSQRLHEIGNGTQITPTHTSGSKTYYLDNYQFQSYVNLTSLDLKSNNGLILKDATTDNAIPAGGFAVTSSYLYLGTADTTIVYNAQTLAVVKKVKKRNAFFSDLATGKLFTLYNTNLNKDPNNVDFSNGIFNAIAELDQNMNMTGIIHPLQKDIRFDEASSIASGFGEVFFSNSQNQSYIFELSTFTIRDFYPHSYMTGVAGTNFASYGFLLRNNAEKNVYFHKGMNTIVKTNLVTLAESVVATFTDSINAVTNIAYSPWVSRWYLSNSTNDELSDFDRVVASAKVTLPSGIVYDTLDNCVSEAIINIPFLDLGEDKELCESQAPYTLTSPATYQSYSWNGNNSNQNTYKVASTQVVTLEVEDENGCVLTDNIKITFTECVGVEETNSIVAKIYPNPTNGLVTVVPNDESEMMNITILDLNGRQLANISTQGIVEINLSDYVSGVYFLAIENINGNIKVEKIIKE